MPSFRNYVKPLPGVKMHLSPKHKKRLALGLGALCLCAGIVAALLMTLQDNVQLYYTPSAVAQGEAPLERPLRIGGMVVAGSIERGEGLDLSFRLTDGRAEVRVNYRGVLPDLFQEGQGVVALGTVGQNGQMRAVQVLAKHDENYMPKEVAESLKRVNNDS
jgi:cytochrome c-type biogenesis protein CcmE